MPDSATGSERRALVDLAVLLPLAALARVVYLAQLQATPLARHLVVDEQGYHLWARAVAAGELLRSGPFYQAPLYPYLLGAWYALFGESLLLVRIVQAAIGIASVALLYGIGRRVFGRTAGLVTGVGGAFYVPFLFYEGQVLKSTLALLLSLIVLALLLRTVKTERRLPWLHAGLGLGVLALLRGNAFLYLPFLALWHLARPAAGGGRRPWGKRAGDLLLLTAGVLLAVSPATLHNLAAGGEVILTTYQGGTNFYMGNHAGALGVYTPIRPGRETPTFEGNDAVEEANRRSGQELSPSAVSRFWFREGLRFAAERPGEFLRLQAVKLLLTWNRREIPDVWDIQFVAGFIPLLRAPLPAFGWIAPLGLLGLGLAYPWRREAGLLALLTLATTLSISAFYVFARYRLPVAPLALLFAGHTVALGIAAVRRRRWAPLAGGLAALIPLVAVVHLDLGRFGLAFTDEVGHQNLGFLYLEDDRPDLAREQFTRAVAVNPDLTNAALMLARLQRQEGEEPAEERTLADLVRHVDQRRAQGATILDPVAEAGARLRLGRLWRASGQEPEAAGQFGLAARLLPQETVALIELGITLRHMGRLPQSRHAYLEALERDPGDPLALYNLANVELDLGDAAAATTRLEEALATCAALNPELCGEIRARLASLSR